MVPYFLTQQSAVFFAYLVVFRKEGTWDVAPRTRKAHFRLLHIEVSYLWRYWVPLFLRLVSTGKPKNPTIWGRPGRGEGGGAF